MPQRTCESCGIKMPPYRARMRHPETNALVCSGCHPDKPGNEGRPVGFHGSKTTAGLACAACSAPMGDAGLVRTAGLLVCAGGCKTASEREYEDCPRCEGTGYKPSTAGDTNRDCPECDGTGQVRSYTEGTEKEGSRKTAATWTQDGEEYWTYDVLDVGEATLTAVMDDARDGRGYQPTGAWEWDAFLYDLLPTRNTGTAPSLAEAKAHVEAYLAGGQQTLASAQAAIDPARLRELDDRQIKQFPGLGKTQLRWTVEAPQNSAYKRRAALAEMDARGFPVSDRLRREVESLPKEAGRLASLTVVAHDSGDGQTVYHCPFCGAGQTVARSDGTVECGFCKTYFTVQVQPEHASMPQTDPLTGQPLTMPGMPGDPATAEQPAPTPTQTTAPAGAGDWAPAGSGGAEGFAPAGQGPMQQFAPAGSALSTAATRHEAITPPFGFDDLYNTWLVNILNPDGSHERVEVEAPDAETASAQVSATGTEVWSVTLLRGGLRPADLTLAASKESAMQTISLRLEAAAEDSPCHICGGDGELFDIPCEHCGGTGERLASLSVVAMGAPEGSQIKKVGDEWVLYHPNGREIARSKDKKLLQDYSTQKDSALQTSATSTPATAPAAAAASTTRTSAMYLTPDQVALPEPSYLAHLAIAHADDREAVIQQVRAERATP